MLATGETIYVPGQGDFPVIDATNGIACVDPRTPLAIPNIGPFLYTPYPGMGEVRAPGASFGDVMALVTAYPELAVEQAVPLVFAWEMSFEEDRFFACHGDTHAGPICGCGHVYNSSSGDHDEEYGISASSVRQITSDALSLNGDPEHGIPMIRSLLAGGHVNEFGVLIVDSKDKTVVPYADGKRFFRYDGHRHRQRLLRLAAYATAKAAAAGLLPVPTNTIFEAKRLRKVAAQQCAATLGSVAAGLPMYRLNMMHGRREVRHVGYVEPVAA